MPELPSPDIKVAPTQEKTVPQKVESKPIRQKAQEMLRKLRTKITGQNLNTDEALTEIATFPSAETTNTTIASLPEDRTRNVIAEKTIVAGKPEEELRTIVGDPQEPQTEKAAIREFSRFTPEGQQARSETAQNILRLRAEGRQAITQKRDFLANSGQIIQQSSERVGAERTELEDQVLALRANLTDRSTSWLAKARAFVSRNFREETAGMNKQLPRLEDELEVKTAITRLVQERNNRELADLERQFQELSRWYRTHPAGRETLQRFYLEQGQLLNKHQEGLELQRKKTELEKYRQEHGTIAEVAKRGNYIVHGITLSPGGTNNRVLENFADWQDKLMVIVSEQPPLSANTFKEGSGPQDLWSQVGVVLKEGVVANAGGDLLSESVNVREKRSAHYSWDIETYQKNLERVLSSSNKFGSYTELVLEFGAQPGAVYINLDQTANTSYDGKGMKFKNPYRDFSDRVGKGTFFGRLDEIDYSEIFEVAEFVGLPVVVIRGGVVFRASLNQDGALVVGKSLSPSEIISMPTHIPDENLLEIQRRSNSVMKTLVAA